VLHRREPAGIPGLMEELFGAVRAACTAAAWSKGVQLVRAGAVVGLRARDEEIELRVTPPGTTLAVPVYLYPDDADWSCDCNSAEDACSHVSAAVIALRQARQGGAALPGQGSEDAAPGRLVYRLSRQRGRLALARRLVRGGEEGPVPDTLTQLAGHSP